MSIISPSKDKSLLASEFYKSHCSGPKQSRMAAVLRLATGFTLPELMVVVAVVSIMIVMGAVSYNRYREQYAFSGAVRELTHAITAARVRAMETQSSSRLVLRPIPANPVQKWKVGTNYAIGDIVQNGVWTYRCLVAHTAVPTALATADHTVDTYVVINGQNPTVDSGTYYGNEPGTTAFWSINWEIIYDYQYNEGRIDVQHCVNNLAVGSQRCGDPAICAWAETKPYNSTNPVSIQFNWFGAPVDYVDHNIMVQGVQDVAAGAGKNRIGCVLLTVTGLGRIRHQGEQ